VPKRLKTNFLLFLYKFFFLFLLEKEDEIIIMDLK
jgi:hypothetical protein